MSDFFEINLQPFTSTPRLLKMASTMHTVDFRRYDVAVVAGRESVTSIGLNPNRQVVDTVGAGNDVAISSYFLV